MRAVEGAHVLWLIILLRGLLGPNPRKGLWAFESPEN